MVIADSTRILQNNHTSIYVGSGRCKDHMSRPHVVENVVDEDGGSACESLPHLEGLFS